MRRTPYTDREGVCESCGTECSAVMQDEGIGDYEYWGSRGVHHDWVEVSPCCGAAVVDGGNKVVKSVIRHAKKDHKDGRVKAGQWYKETAIFKWRSGGPGWVEVEKRIVNPPVVSV